MTKLYKHERRKSEEKFGFINGAILSDAYVIGSTRNIFLDSISIILLTLTLIGLIGHGLLRWYFTKGHSNTYDGNISNKIEDKN